MIFSDIISSLDHACHTSITNISINFLKIKTFSFRNSIWIALVFSFLFKYHHKLLWTFHIILNSMNFFSWLKKFAVSNKVDVSMQF